MAKKQTKSRKNFAVKKRKLNEEQRKMDHQIKSSITAEWEKDSKNSMSSGAGEEDADFHLPKTSTKRKKQLQEKQPAVDLNLDPMQ